MEFFARPDGIGPMIVVGPDPECREIATVPRKGNQARQEADARLIAAAPDLLGALVLAAEIVAESEGIPSQQHHGGEEAFLVKARAAIRKATGDE